jgi:gliding motility-associated-like protein
MFALIKKIIQKLILVFFFLISFLIILPKDSVAQSCWGNCGTSGGTCWCDDSCWALGDCCSDICTYCGTWSQTMIDNCGSGGCVATAPYPSNDPCYQTVISNDPFCCDVSWDATCQSAYDNCNPSNGCVMQASICTPGVAGPYSFNTATPHQDFYQGCLNTEQGFNNYGFILLNITTSGYLNMLIDANTNNGYLDVSLFNVPQGQDPCVAILNAANNIGCGFAQNEGGCNQFGNTFPCNSNFNAPYVTAGQQIMIIVQDWGAFNNLPSGNSSFSLTLSTSAGSAGTGPLNATINPVGNICINDGNINLTSVTGGGTWSASCGNCINSETGVFNPIISGIGIHTIYYTVGESPCIGNASTTVNVLESNTPVFTQLGPYCTGDTPGVLSTTSNNGITGTWNPATINTTIAGTTTYVFTPSTGQCAAGTSMNVLVEQTLTPTFNGFGPYCQGDTPAALPNTSNNVVNGTWNPATITTSTSGTTTYTFTPSGGQCAIPTSIDVIVETNETPFFTQLGPYCVGDIPDALPTVSNNGIPGTWSPAVVSTTTSGNTTYTFTPNPSVCAVSQTMTITVNPGVDPEFDQLGPYCIGDTPDALLTTSINGITGSWNPSVISTATHGNHTYTFTPDAGQCAEIYTMNISVNDLTVPDFNNLSPYCEGDNPDQLPLTSLNGITGTWNPATINTSTAGVFTHTFTPTSGECVTTVSMDIVINPNPEVIITETQPVMCFGETAILSVSAVDGTPNYDGVGDFEVNAGNHSFTITDANTCIGAASFTVNQPDALIISASLTADNLCYGDNLTWDGGSVVTEDNQYSITNLAGGYLNIFVTDANDCNDSTTIEISSPAELMLDVISTTDMVCSTHGSATVAASGGTPSYTYIWPSNAGGVNQGTANELSPGTYTVTVRDSNNCENTVSFEISGTGNIDATTSILNHPLCNGDANGRIIISFTEGTPNFNINWGIGSSVSVTNEYTINGLPAGNYNITVTDVYGCQQILNSILTDPPVLSASVTSLTDQTCATPGSAVISATGGTPQYTYLWPANASGVDGNTASGLMEGGYAVTVRDANECQTIVNFTISDFTEISVSSTVLSHISCHGYADAQVAVLIQDGSLPYTISWDSESINTSSNQHIINNLDAGLLSVTVIDSYGCIYEEDLIINEPAPIEASFTTTNPSCAGMNDGSIEIIVAGGTEPYMYSYNNINTDIHFIERLYDGQYLIMVYDANECAFDLGTVILIENSDDCLEIPNAFSPNGDGVNDTWIIQNIGMFPSATISVFNKWGQLLYFARGNEDPWDGTYNGKFVPTGTFVYIIKLQNRSDSITGTVTVVY